MVIKQSVGRISFVGWVMVFMKWMKCTVKKEAKNETVYASPSVSLCFFFFDGNFMLFYYDKIVVICTQNYNML